MRFLLALIVTMLCLQAYNAVPKESSESNHFEDWISLVKYLQQNGINVNQAQWYKINAMCSGLNKEDDKTVYNRCRFDKAAQQAAHGRDRIACSRRARLEYPQLLQVRRQPHERYITVMQNGKATQVAIAPRYPRRSTQNLRDLVFEDCMDSFNWVSSNRWEGGQRLPVQQFVTGN